MQLPIVHVDAFEQGPFTGNPAAVCVLQQWLADDLMQRIAMQNNLSETAFLVAAQDASEWHLRWFTPAAEVDLCGHATLASAHVLTCQQLTAARQLTFLTRSGRLRATVLGPGQYRLDLPARKLRPLENLERLGEQLGLAPIDGVRAVDDWLIVLRSEKDVANYQPDFEQLRQIAARGVIISAQAAQVDFVSRFFAPRVGVNEDPVTGSAHCTLVPYWAAKTGRARLKARQLSSRGGSLDCELAADRVWLDGRCRTWLSGTIELA